MTGEARKHLARAKDYVARGEEFYRKAADEIVAARAADFSLTWDDVARDLGKSDSWCQAIVSWSTNPQGTGGGSLPFSESRGAVAQRHARSVLTKAEPEEIAETLLSDPVIRAKVSKAQALAYDGQAETLRERKHEREVERKGGEQEHAEFTRRQRIGEVVNVARGAASGMRFVAGQVKSLNLADEDSGVAEELLTVLNDIEGFVSMVRSYLGGETVSDEDIAALIGGGDE